MTTAIRNVVIVAALGASVVALIAGPSGGASGPRCLDRAESATVARGEVFVMSCPSGEGRFVVVGKGFLAQEVVDIIYEDQPMRPVSVTPSAARADNDGAVRLTVTPPAAAKRVELFATSGLRSGAPLFEQPRRDASGR